jgi:hypothetical protein
METQQRITMKSQADNKEAETNWTIRGPETAHWETKAKSKPKGKGKEPKSKGKGKSQEPKRTPCKFCGGDHWQSECTKRSPQTRGSPRDEKSTPRPPGKEKQKEPELSEAPNSDDETVSEFAQGARSYAFRVPRMKGPIRDRMLKAATEMGFEPMQAAIKGLHPVSHEVRNQAVVTCLSDAWKEGFKTVLDWCGAGRTRSILDVIHKATSDRMALHVVGEPVLALDYLRRPVVDHLQSLDLTGQSVAVLFVDIYHDVSAYDGTEFSPMCVHEIFSAIKLRGAKEVRGYWIGHRFAGAAGTIHAEGAWIRTQAGILSLADSESAAYGPHPSCDWLHSGGSYPVGKYWVAPIETVVYKDTRIVQLRYVDGSLKFSEQHAEAKFELVELELPDTRSARGAFLFSVYDFFSLDHVWGLSRLKALIPRRREIIDKRIARHVIEQASLRQITTFSVRDEVSRLREAYTLDPDYQLVIKLFPAEFDALLRHTIFYALSHGYACQAEELDLLQRFNAYDHDLQNRALRRFGAAPVNNSHRLMWLGASLAVVGGLIIIGAKTLAAVRQVKSYVSAQIGLPRLEMNLFGHPLSPVVETALYCAHPLVGLCLGVYEGWNQGNVPWRAMFHGALGFATWLSFSAGGGVAVVGCALSLLAHALWNAASVENDTRFQEFKRAYYELPWRERTIVDRHTICVSALIVDGERNFLPAQVKSHYDLPDLCPHLVVTGGLDDVGEELPQNGIHAFIAHNMPLYRPANSVRNRIDVLYGRVLAKPPMAPSDQYDSWITVRKVDRWIPLLLPIWPELKREDYERTWLERLDLDATRRRRLQPALVRRETDELRASDREYNRIDNTVKTDEVLARLTPVGVSEYAVGMKPRAVQAIDIHPAAEQGPLVEGMMARAKSAFPMAPDHWIVKAYVDEPRVLPSPLYLRNGYAVYPVFGSSSTANDLRLIAEAVKHLRRAIVIVVAGDDSLVIVVSATGVIKVIVGDFGMFDQSQSLGPLMVQWKAMERMGLSVQDKEKFVRLAFAKLVARGHNGDTITVHRLAGKRPMRNTGGTDTTLGNSLVNLFTWLESLDDVDPMSATPAVLEAAFAWSGFKIKVRVYNTLVGAEFLKGMFYETIDGQLAWSLLPSAILKRTKSLVDPRRIFDVRDEVTNLRYAMAAREFLAVQAADVRHFGEVPILRAFVARYAKEVKGYVISKRHSPELKEAHKVSYGETPKIDQQAAVTTVCSRYGLSPQDIERVEKAILTGPEFKFIEDPVFLRLALVDYN